MRISYGRSMLFDLPDDDTLYAALLARDAGHDGRADVGVSSTDVLCRLTCPARKPQRENGANRLAIVIRGHRMIGADGSLTGFGGGLWRKQRLIELEQGYARKETA